MKTLTSLPVFVYVCLTRLFTYLWINVSCKFKRSQFNDFHNGNIGLRPAPLLKKRLWHRCFPVNFVKFLRTPFLQNTCGRLLLEVKKTLYYKDVKFIESEKEDFNQVNEAFISRVKSCIISWSQKHGLLKTLPEWRTQVLEPDSNRIKNLKNIIGLHANHIPFTGHRSNTVLKTIAKLNFLKRFLCSSSGHKT